jgi:hypothetical protein
VSVDRWLVNSLPLWLLGLTLVGGLAAIGVAGAALVRRRVSAVAEGDYAETAKTMLTHLLAVYSLVLAFVVVNENQGYTQARTDVQTEALNVEDFYRSTRGFADPAAQELTATTRDYVRTVVNEEWERLEDGKASPRASADLNRMYAIMRNYEPEGARAGSLYSASLDDLHAAHDARHRRLNRATNGLPPVLAVFLVVGALAILAVTCLLGGQRRSQLLVPLSLGAVLGFTLLLALTLEYPFSGTNAIPSTHFREGQLAEFFQPAP